MRKRLPSILFNAGETALVVFSGLLLGISWVGTLFILVFFTATRLIIGKPKHYKKWQLCLFWSTTTLASLFLTGRVNTLLSILLSIFAAIIVSGHADIYQWSPHMERKNKLKAIRTVDEFESLVSNVIMKPKYKDLLRYLYLEDMTLMQAAEKLNIEYSTAKVWHGEALAKLFDIA